MTRLEISRKVLTELSREELENFVLVRMLEVGAIAAIDTPLVIMAQLEVYTLVGEKSYQEAVDLSERIVKRQYEIGVQQSQQIKNN